MTPIPTLMRRLLSWRAGIIAAEGGPMFMGLPDRWFDDPHYRCRNGHVSTVILASEERGDLCLSCHEPCCLTFPEDRDGPIEVTSCPVR